MFKLRPDEKTHCPRLQRRHRSDEIWHCDDSGLRNQVIEIIFIAETKRYLCCTTREKERGLKQVKPQHHPLDSAAEVCVTARKRTGSAY